MLTFPVLLVIACAVMALPVLAVMGWARLFKWASRHLAKEHAGHDAVMRRLDL